MAELKDRRDAILYIAEQRRGTKDALIHKIGEDFYNQFCRMGFIKKGVSIAERKAPTSTWQITELGKKQKEFYREPNHREKELGKIYFSLGI